MRQAASKLVAPSARIALEFATSGASEIAGAVVDAGLKVGSKELEKAANDFWKKKAENALQCGNFKLR